MSQQEDQGERQQYEEEAYHLSLDADPRFLAWLEYEHQRLMALIHGQADFFTRNDTHKETSNAPRFRNDSIKIPA